MPAARDEDWSAIAAQAAAGATHEQLAEHWDIPLGTIKARCTREGWKRMAREIQEQKTGNVVDQRHQTVHPRASSRSVTLMPRLGEKSKLCLARAVNKTAKALQRQTPTELKKNTQALRNTTGAWKDLHGEAIEGAKTLVNINLLGSDYPESGLA